MKSLNLFITLFLFSFSYFFLGAESDHLQHSNSKSLRPNRLFVFGDSYADTGNIRKSLSDSWKIPYGITFPQKPSGRFSDGRVATDFLARYLGIKSPIPYTWKDYAGKERLLCGMNYAYGGTGVFKTKDNPLPNMTTQIDYFERILTARNIYSPSHLPSSLALVSVAGNDYATFMALKRPLTELPAFMQQVVGQIEANARRIHKLGVKKIAITSMQPLGCLPSITVFTSFQRCNATDNISTNLHNYLLHKAVARLNNETKPSTFVVLDHYNAFLTVFKNKGPEPGVTRFGNPLEPCCVGIDSNHDCSNVDEKGEKKYTVCEDPKGAFFWDIFHPTEEGWRSVYSVLHKSLTEVWI
ncbi:PREDICTED: GDSL esterase/lipase At3g09930-like [Camelina sativa]|uniref:GDSL esterase/lipase At3g09930-like n=1 Tax=Camelina sativa TaxID=90675 RepID=A0ABM0XIR0_CAMSA|nr:PREDICTED: GDSL esterase/lipase At3g09930-like [Camelina sativa]XP_010486572.1 PREDICTED: GDSL esterase/lipase At3g09930-like [Camelina sativa]XP_010486573.1 PREDICTED: GDSL esterase/lipase At3g09930-like [Camelina sativa]XP_010486575.1 PREDICTED: GDSL esterase/lipase At3g09930-like [Camelina sativa]